MLNCYRTVLASSGKTLADVEVPWDIQTRECNHMNLMSRSSRFRTLQNDRSNLGRLWAHDSGSLALLVFITMSSTRSTGSRHQCLRSSPHRVSSDHWELQTERELSATALRSECPHSALNIYIIAFNEGRCFAALFRAFPPWRLLLGSLCFHRRSCPLARLLRRCAVFALSNPSVYIRIIFPL